MLYVRDNQNVYRRAHVVNKWTKQHGFWAKSYHSDWNIGEWGACEGICGEQGVQHRRVRHYRLLLNQSGTTLLMPRVFADTTDKPIESRVCQMPACPSFFTLHHMFNGYYTWSRRQFPYFFGNFIRVIDVHVYTYKSVIWVGPQSYPTDETVIFNNANENKSATYYDGRDRYILNKDISSMCHRLTNNYFNLNVYAQNQANGGRCSIRFHVEY